ncbi:MAG: RidA family protein [Endozoicomonadaceae bacterium]|nr:RidA family protein [Endozoicomonadaceae bacterium]MCY4328839.1 RidA family protein [Endozoicomonadaceae bacterium]
MKQYINTQKAPEAIGPYSQCVVLNEMVYTSGQLGLIPESMKFPEGGIEAQSKQALHNLKNVLEAAESSLDHVLKITCFIADMNDFAAFNQVYAEFFNQSKPARSCVEVARLPKNALIELEAIAYKA